MIEDILIRGWDNFVARTTGPMNFRFMIQPAVATLLAIRAGLKDAREHRPAYLWSVLTTRVDRQRALMREGFKDASKVFVLAVTLDVVYQLSVQRAVYTLELLFTAVTLALVPYVLVRGPVNRIATWVRMIGERHHGARTAR